MLEWTAVARPLAGAGAAPADVTLPWSCDAGGGGASAAAGTAIIASFAISVMLGFAYLVFCRHPPLPSPATATVRQHVSYAMPITATRPMEAGSPSSAQHAVELEVKPQCV